MDGSEQGRNVVIESRSVANAKTKDTRNQWPGGQHPILPPGLPPGLPSGLPPDLPTASLTAAGDIAYAWDIEDDSITWMGESAQIFDGRAGNLTNGEAFSECINPDDLSNRLRILNRHFSIGEAYDCEYRIRHMECGFQWVHDRGAAVFDASGVPRRLHGVLRVITDRKHQEALLEHRANFDDLTGHFNKLRLREALQTAIAYNTRHEISGGFLIVGIDKLSVTRKKYGHDVADAVLIGTSHRIERCLRATDIIGRIDGDRFGIILSHCDSKGIEVTANKILNTIRGTAIQTPTGGVAVTVSIGGIAFPGLIRSAVDAMENADKALREAKYSGCNTFILHELTEEQRTRRQRMIAVGKQTLDAIADDRITLAYQPVVDAHSHAIQYYETLVRMYEPSGRLANPDEFVPALERLGTIRQLDLRALELTIRGLERSSDMRLAVNVSSLTITDPVWLRALVSLIHGRRNIAERLIVEITETAALEDFDVTARFVESIHDLGCKVALDDFGSGYTSFKHVKSLTVDVVKIDGTFVFDLDSNRENEVFIQTRWTWRAISA